MQGRTRRVLAGFCGFPPQGRTSLVLRAGALLFAAVPLPSMGLLMLIRGMGMGLALHGIGTLHKSGFKVWGIRKAWMAGAIIA